MTNELTRRLEALEKRMNAEQPSGTLPPGGPLRVVIVQGTLPPGANRSGAYRDLTNGRASRERISTHSLIVRRGGARAERPAVGAGRARVDAGVTRRGAL